MTDDLMEAFPEQYDQDRDECRRCKGRGWTWTPATGRVACPNHCSCGKRMDAPGPCCLDPNQ